MAMLGNKLVYGNNPVFNSTGTGAQTQWTLSWVPGTASSLEVLVGGVQQIPDDDYIVAGTTLTFETAPADTVPFTVIGRGIGGVVNVPGAGTINSDSLNGGPVNGLVKSNGTTFGAAVAGVDFASVIHTHSEYEPADPTILKSAAIGVSVQAYDADIAKIDVEQTWTAQQTPKNGTLTDAANIDWNGDTNGQVVKVTLTDSRTLNAPTNINENALYVLRVIQDGTGSRTLAWNAAFKFGSGTLPTLTAAANAVDVFTFLGGATDTLFCVGQALDLK